jgi:predicted nucleic acid-binding protein
MENAGYLLDTNVVSVLRQPEKEPEVANFLLPLNPSHVFLSVMTLGELRKGVFNKRRGAPDGVASLHRWVEQIGAQYSERVIPVDAVVAKLWGEFSAGRSRPVVDTLLAATAVVHRLTLVTRNVLDFQGLPVAVFNPWNG